MQSKINQKGFTIVEVMLALFILSVAIGASVTLITQAISLVSFNESSAIAASLAQEGLEIVRNVRDTNWLAQRTDPGVSWKSGLGAGDYEADYDDPALASNQDRYLAVGDNGFYYYSAFGDPATQTRFKRKISIVEPDEKSLEVTVLVSWEERGRSHNIRVAEKFYNWYGY